MSDAEIASLMDRTMAVFSQTLRKRRCGSDKRTSLWTR